MQVGLVEQFPQEEMIVSIWVMITLIITWLIFELEWYMVTIQGGLLNEENHNQIRCITQISEET